MKMEKNKQDAKGGLVQHVESVSNVATDASNLDRINRWNCALLMFADRPVFGYGPGTYQFVYSPFQKSYEKTVISTNTGNRGTAHSEYLLILSEEGLLGGLSLLVIFSLIVYFALQNMKIVKDKELRFLNLLLFLGIVTYMAHAFFNNFLDTDKAAIPFWGFTAALIAINIKAKSDEVS
jgi:O-antigen ligase